MEFRRVLCRSNGAGGRGSAGRKPAAPGGCARRALVEPYWLQCNRTARPGESDMDRPDYLAAGEPARLIPVTADGNKELRAASILLATLSSVRPFAQELIGSLGQRIGKRASLACYTEVVFREMSDHPKDRPHGLLVLEGGSGRVCGSAELWGGEGVVRSGRPG